MIPHYGAVRTAGFVNIGTAESGHWGHEGLGKGGGQGSKPGNKAPEPKSTKRAPALSDMDTRLIESGKMGFDRAEKIAAWLPDGVQEYGKTALSDNRSLKEYGGENYILTNSFLRNDEISVPLTPDYMGMGRKQFTAEDIKGQISDIDTVINNSPDLPKGLTLWRGVGSANGERIAALEIGDTCHDKAFQSHSLNPHTAYTFAKGWGAVGVDSEDDADIKQKAIAGYQATVIRAVTKSGMKGVYMAETVSKEHEVLMPRGTEWKVIGKDKFEFHGDNYGQGTVHIITVVAT